MLFGMKTKNRRELEKYWGEQARKAAKPQGPKKAKKKAPREDANQPASSREM